MNKELVSQVLENLGSKEFGNKPLPPIDQLSQRLSELLEGRRVPVVIFNCIDFEWRTKPKNYPESIISSNTATSICAFFQQDILAVMRELNLLGRPQLSIIIPDSELFDDRPFSFAQDLRQRQDIGNVIRTGLTRQLTALADDNGSPVFYWSEYCQSRGLLSPLEYTSRNYEKIKTDPKLFKKVKDQTKDSKRYFVKNGLNPEYIKDIADEEICEKVCWYCAMYAGEGQALSDSKAITVNLEDRRVPLWFQRGAADSLPILSPVDPNIFYSWRKSIKL